MSKGSNRFKKTARYLSGVLRHPHLRIKAKEGKPEPATAPVRPPLAAPRSQLSLRAAYMLDRRRRTGSRQSERWSKPKIASEPASLAA